MSMHISLACGRVHYEGLNHDCESDAFIISTGVLFADLDNNIVTDLYNSLRRPMPIRNVSDMSKFDFWRVINTMQAA